MNTIHTSAFTFDLPLEHRDLPNFRGAISALAGREKDLFHNHDNRPGSDRSFHQRYPLVQYRIHGGKASIFGVNEGARAIEQLLQEQQFGAFRMNGRRLPLALSSYHHNPDFVPRITEEHHFYRIYSYIPFSFKAFQEYESLPSLHAKIDHLERLLRNHIVAFAYAVNWKLPEDRRIKVNLLDLDSMQKVRIKGHQLMAFDMAFTSNALLPKGVGIGRKTAFGLGVTVPSQPTN